MPRTVLRARFSRHNQCRRRESGGQSLVEFALIMPVLLVLVLGIADLGRIYASMITIESAARETADWAANGGPSASGKWDVGLIPATISQMERRACTPAMNLPDYVGAANGSTCTNPAFECFIDDPETGVRVGCARATDCYDPTGTRSQPCVVQVLLTYDFDLALPTGLLALPPTITFERDSSFNISYR